MLNLRFANIKTFIRKPLFYFKNVINSCYCRTKNIIIIIFPVKNKKHARSYMLNDNQFTVHFNNKLNFFKKTKWLPNERKIMFESISMAGACCFFKPCHQVPLKVK